MPPDALAPAAPRPATPAAVEAYGFRPVVPADLPLIAGWLARPHVAEWWDGDGLGEIREALTDPATRPHIVALGGRPIGYLQCYDPHREEGHPYRDQPPGTLGIDQFIGEPDLVGIGHGSRLIGAFVAGLFREGAVRVVTDPDPANGRAVRAYEKAGFRALGRRHSVYGSVLLMACDAPLRSHDGPPARDATTPSSPA
ncbi:MAG TPA: GNAT family N-acetyltransferase [Microvirga sp.]|jgi:aminoglycoside 6'-N-acetyltransferase|nr:GNAT family N-acetyltransferase [Microvirga sp.]